MQKSHSGGGGEGKGEGKLLNALSGIDVPLKMATEERSISLDFPRHRTGSRIPLLSNTSVHADFC